MAPTGQERVAALQVEVATTTFSRPPTRLTGNAST
jgi:hypothetical protein